MATHAQQFESMAFVVGSIFGGKKQKAAKSADEAIRQFQMGGFGTVLGDSSTLPANFFKE